MKTYSAYQTYTEKCPYCGGDCECDWVDVGIGLRRAGPFFCENCFSSEMHVDDFERDDVTEEEKEKGWFKGSEKISKLANSINGVLVDHHTAEVAYKMGILDPKK